MWMNLRCLLFLFSERVAQNKEEAIYDIYGANALEKKQTRAF